METDILKFVLQNVCTTSKSLQQVGRQTITSRLSFGRNEPVSSTIGGNQSQNFSPIGSSDQTAALNMCESQLSPAPNDHEAAEILGSLSLPWQSSPDEDLDLSASQQIHTGIPAFRVNDDETPTKKTLPKVKEVSREYLYGYH